MHILSHSGMLLHPHQNDYNIKDLQYLSLAKLQSNWKTLKTADTVQDGNDHFGKLAVSSKTKHILTIYHFHPKAHIQEKLVHQTTYTTTLIAALFIIAYR